MESAKTIQNEAERPKITQNNPIASQNDPELSEKEPK